jgi:hypothetical protein
MIPEPSLSLHRSSLNLDAQSDSWEKLRWLVSYHNSTVQRLKKGYGRGPAAFDIVAPQPFEIPDSLMIDSALSDAL